jgi:hypothetical protein
LDLRLRSVVLATFGLGWIGEASRSQGFSLRTAASSINRYQKYSGYLQSEFCAKDPDLKAALKLKESLGQHHSDVLLYPSSR